MGTSIQKYRGAGAGEILSLNIEDLDVVELEHRLEMAVAMGAAIVCIVKYDCACNALTSCGYYCY